MKKYNKNIESIFNEMTGFKFQTDNENLYKYQLNLYEKDMSSKLKHKMFVKTINDEYDGDAEMFVNDINKFITEVTEHLKSNPLYEEFYKKDFSEYKRENKIGHNDLYTESNCNKCLVRIQLITPDFQALCKFHPDLVDGKSSYQEYIEQFRKNWFFINNNRLKRELFYHIDKSRIRIIKNWMTYNIYDNLLKTYSFLEPISISCDEIVYSYADFEDPANISSFISNIESHIKYSLDISVNAEVFTIERKRLRDSETNDIVCDFFIKNNLGMKPDELKKIPEEFYNIAYKLYKNMKIVKNDMKFVHNNCVCGIVNKLKLE